MALAVVCENEVKEKSEWQMIIPCILPHKKNAIQAKDKIKPGSAASFPGFSIVYLCITPRRFELVICQM